MTIFLVLNGMALVFMLYVLVNFWREGTRTARSGGGTYRLQSPYGRKSGVFVVTRPLEVAAGRPDNITAIRFPAAKERAEMVGAKSA